MIPDGGTGVLEIEPPRPVITHPVEDIERHRSILQASIHQLSHIPSRTPVGSTPGDPVPIRLAIPFVITAFNCFLRPTKGIVVFGCSDVADPERLEPFGSVVIVDIETAHILGEEFRDSIIGVGSGWVVVV